MSKRSKFNVSADPAPHQGSGDDDPDLPLWIDGDEDRTPGRNWTLILIFAVVPLMTLVALVLSLFALFSEMRGDTGALDPVIESKDRRS